MRGPWEKSLEESKRIQSAIGIISELSREEREFEVSVYNSILRQKVYKREVESYKPVFIYDGWGTPRWKQAEDNFQ
jgi:hypothetical protein